MATLLPNGRQYYALPSGQPNANGFIVTSDSGTNNPRATYADAAQTAPNATTLQLDSRGECVAFWSGNYRVRLLDAASGLIWQQDDVQDQENALRAELAAGNPLLVGSTAIKYDRTAAEIAAGVTPTDYSRSPPIGVDVRRYGVVGDGTADDSQAMTRAISTGLPLDLGDLTVNIVTKLVFNQANQHIFARKGGFKFGGVETTRLMDITVSGVEFYNVDFDGNNKQVKGGLWYVASNAARFKFVQCRFRRINGTHVGGVLNTDANFQYAGVISPYGVDGFEIDACVFEEIRNDNSGINSVGPLTGIGFCGGLFFLTDDWATPVTPQGIPTSGTVRSCLFKNIITVLGSGLSVADQQSFNDADGIRYFGDAAGATKLHVKVTDCLFYDCSKRAIKNSSSTGTMGNNLTVVATSALQYPMVTAIKLDGEDQIYTNINVYSPSASPCYIIIQSHDCKNLRVRNVRANRCSLLWNLAPISTATVSEDWLVDGLSCNEVLEGGIYASSNCDRYVNVKFKDVTIEAKSNIHNLPAVRVTANTDRMEFELSDSRIVGGDVKIAGYGWVLRGIYHEINDASYTGFSATVGLLEAGLDPANAVTRDSVFENYELNIKALPNGYLTASRTYIWLLYGKKLKVKNFHQTVPNALATTFSHGAFGGGDDTEINDFSYDGSSFINYGTIFTGPHRRMNLNGARRIGGTTAAQNFLQINNGEDCELSSIYDGRDCAAFGSIIIAGGTISGGHAKAYIVDTVHSMTTAANVVTDGGAKALQVDVNKF